MIPSEREVLVFKAVSISAAIISYLKVNFKAKVHSVFKKSFNLVSNKGIFITIAQERLKNIPNGILVNNSLDISFNSLKLKEGMVAKIKDSFLLIPEARVSISLNNAKSWSSCPKWDSSLLPFQKIKNNIRYADKLARDKGSSKGLGMLLLYREDLLKGNVEPENDLDRFAQIAFKFLSELVQGIKIGDFKLIRNSIPRLIGLGVGLTPSADDILLGLMGGLVYLGNRLGQEEYISLIGKEISHLAKGRTTIISQTYLQYAAKGEVSEVVKDMIEAVLTYSNEKRIISTTFNVLSIGSSSGSEIALGVMLGIELGLELFKYSNQEEN